MAERRTMTNVVWSISSKIAIFTLKFVSVPILARYLQPAELGMVASGMIVVTFLLMFAGAGLTSGLIREAVEDRVSDDTVFWANLGVATTLAILVYLFASPLAELLGAPEANWLLQVFAPLFVLYLGPDVASSKLARRMAFDKEAICSVISEALGSIAAVVVVLMGGGIWALIAQLYVSAVFRFVGLFLVSRYRPGFHFSGLHLKRHMNYGVRLVGADFVNFLSFQSPIVVITRMLGLPDAGTFNLTNRLSDLPNQIVLTGLMSVLFPSFSRMNDDGRRQAEVLSRTTRATTLLLAPMLFGIWAVSEPAMIVVFGEKWAFAAPVLAWLAVSKGIMSPCGSFIPYLKATGHASTLWWFGLGRAISVLIAMILGTWFYGLVGLCVAMCIVNLGILFAYLAVVLRVAGLALRQGIKDVMVPLVIAAVMALAVRLSLADQLLLSHTPLARLLAGAAIGGVIYGVLVMLTQRKLVLDLVRRQPV
ncbi:lipopolysaccharide biosynthesis protein [Rhizobium oryzicola]|uniref:Lipopolysaccharide biosynthesis protein n=1 Tax=Rhizobium oryzicola TaxID=1232668 RepID=A0ABT8SZ13_9HYPH|nr:lipopolysaccharide biosynthesis protein [Rhizobium oryzicola]MDO1583675.1 lipopolysaccharide biosynthesis protein [Rhizobium oryzicola]